MCSISLDLVIRGASGHHTTPHHESVTLTRDNKYLVEQVLSTFLPHLPPPSPSLAHQLTATAYILRKPSSHKIIIHADAHKHDYLYRASLFGGERRNELLAEGRMVARRTRDRAVHAALHSLLDNVAEKVIEHVTWSWNMRRSWLGMDI